MRDGPLRRWLRGYRLRSMLRANSLAKEYLVSRSRRKHYKFSQVSGLINQSTVKCIIVLLCHSLTNDLDRFCVRLYFAKIISCPLSVVAVDLHQPSDLRAN